MLEADRGRAEEPNVRLKGIFHGKWRVARKLPWKVFKIFYSVFQGFRQAKSSNGGSILSWSQFLILPQLPQKMKLPSNVVKVDSKIIISLPKI